MNTQRLIGGILLIVGTSLGGGMLVLPIATASLGFWDSTLFLSMVWLAMTLSAFFILEANLWLPRGANIISMARQTLKWPGLIAAWLSYLFLLYTLLSAYIDGGSDVINALLTRVGFGLPDPLTTCLFVLAFALIVYSGIRSVDKLNSLLMFVKLSVYGLLLFSISPHINLKTLSHEHTQLMAGSIMVMVTSFGFAIIVPSLREYFEDDVKSLRRVILIGTIFPLLCYVAWDAVIMGVIPASGKAGLIALNQSTHSTSGLSKALELAVNNHSIDRLFRFFSTVCILTAFLAVSLCLFDFLADGLKLKRKGRQGLLVACLVFGPPLLLNLCFSGLYIKAFALAGYFCVILLLILPALMVAFGRYKYHLNKAAAYQVPGGKLTIAFVLLVSLLILIAS
jgi:tyrosine-specific transport protein